MREEKKIVKGTERNWLFPFVFEFVYCRFSYLVGFFFLSLSLYIKIIGGGRLLNLAFYNDCVAFYSEYALCVVFSVAVCSYSISIHNSSSYGIFSRKTSLLLNRLLTLKQWGSLWEMQLQTGKMFKNSYSGQKQHLSTGKNIQIFWIPFCWNPKMPLRSCLYSHYHIIIWMIKKELQFVTQGQDCIVRSDD